MPQSTETDTYRLDRMRSTPYPNRLLERSVTLPETQVRIVNLIVRSTLGWQGGSPGTRKASAYFAFSELRKQVGRGTGLSVRQALDGLVTDGILEVLGPDGEHLPSARYAGRPLRLRI